MGEKIVLKLPQNDCSNIISPTSKTKEMVMLVGFIQVRVCRRLLDDFVMVKFPHFFQKMKSCELCR